MRIRTTWKTSFNIFSLFISSFSEEEKVIQIHRQFGPSYFSSHLIFTQNSTFPSPINTSLHKIQLTRFFCFVLLDQIIIRKKLFRSKKNIGYPPKIFAGTILWFLELPFPQASQVLKPMPKNPKDHQISSTAIKYSTVHKF